MSEPSDFPDSFEPEQSFDPTEHFEPLAEGHAEPVFEGIVEHSDAEHHEPHDAEAVAEETDYPNPPYAFHHDDAPPFKAPVGRGILAALVAGVVLVSAGYLFKEVAGIQPAPPAAPATTAAAPAAPAPADDSKALAGRVDGLKGDLDGLGKRVDDLQKAIAAIPVTDLKPLQAQIEALGKKVESMPGGDTKGIESKLADAVKGQSAMAAQISSVSDQTAAVSKALASHKTQFEALESKVNSLGSSPATTTTIPTPAPAAAAPAATTTSSSTNDADYAKAVDLFKKGQYAPAKDSFTKLTASSPTDARVWYYAAISSGFASNDWETGAKKLVLKGVELEKAGTTPGAKLTAAFADLPATAKAWLDFYRAQAK